MAGSIMRGFDATRLRGGIALGLLLLPLAAFAHHTVFEYAVDRFEADGNLHGPADGTPDFVDEFDDGVLAPFWQRFFGTVFESDGLLILENPGTHFQIPGLPFELDQSIALSSGPV